VILALIGLTMGQAVVWYTGQFYALFFMTQVLKIDGANANIMTALSLALATPFFIFFGMLSDKIGRKYIILGGCVLAAATYFPLFGALTHYGNPQLEAALKNSPVVVYADPASCNFQFNPTGQKKFTSSCDIATSILSNASVNYTKQDAPAGSVAKIKVGDKEITAFNAVLTGRPELRRRQQRPGRRAEERSGRHRESGRLPSQGGRAQINKPMMVLILFILVLYVTMVYGPIAAMLVEMFPTRIRYTSMSLPYHIGNGWFGGLLPTISFALVAFKGDIYYGLWYPIIIALITVVIGTLFIGETKDNNIYAGD
jgi:MFS family permease